MPNELVSRLSPKTILVIGDVMLDEFLWCQVSRISPEAPVPVCNVSSTTRTPGGAANVAANIFSLGSTPQLVGLVGQDQAGEDLRRALTDRQLSDAHLIASATRPTTLKTRIIAHQQHVARVDTEDKSEVVVDATIALNIAAADVVVISDYAKGFVSKALIETIVSQAKDSGTVVIGDPKGMDADKYKGVSILTPNRAEFRDFVGDWDSEDQLHEKGQALCARLGLDALVLTRSEEGMSVIRPGQDKVDIATQAIDVYDITGAGDTVIAAMAVGLANELSVVDAATLATQAAGKVVAKVGTATVSLDELHG